MLREAPGNPRVLREMLDDDVEWDVGAVQILGGTGPSHGPESVMEFFRQWVGTFTGWGYEVLELFEHRDSVIVELRQWGTGKASGIRVEQRWWQVWTMRDGKAIRATNHQTREEALADAEAP